MLTHWGRVTPYGVGKFNTVSGSRSGFLMSRASFQVPTCLCFDQWLLKWLVMQTAAASSAAAVCITRRFSNRWPRFPKFTRPQWVKLVWRNIHQFLHQVFEVWARRGKIPGYSKVIVDLTSWAGPDLIHYLQTLICKRNASWATTESSNFMRIWYIERLRRSWSISGFIKLKLWLYWWPIRQVDLHHNEGKWLAVFCLESNRMGHCSLANPLHHGRLPGFSCLAP